MRRRLLTLGLALALALGLLVATRQIEWGRWYANEYVYRAQVDALLSGRFALTDAPAGLYHDLAWTPSGVQQVWGLGAPLLQTPFEIVGRVLGVSPVPDRVAMVCWIAFGIFVLLRAFPGWMGIGVLCVTALLPPVIAMLRSRCQVYEDAALYAYVAALVLAGGLAIFARTPTRRRYLLLLAAAGATGLIRPTVWFYGLGTAIAATVIWWRAGGRRSIAVGALLFVLGGGALYATNAIRFGSGTEFGHRLNLEALPGNLVATRFSYPFEHVGALDAAKEELGALFDRPEARSKKGYYQKELHVGQVPVPRWREYYFTTYSWAWVPLLVAGLVVGGLAVRRRDRTGAALLGFALGGAVPLFVFYLHAPSISSRYQLDLAPAFAVLLLLGWRALAAWLDLRVALPIVVGLWAAAVATAQIHRTLRGSEPMNLDEAMDFVDVSRPMPDEYARPDGIDVDDPLALALLDRPEGFERCADATGAQIPCARLGVDGDVRYRGVSIDRQWYIRRSRVEERPDACYWDPRERAIVEDFDALLTPLPSLFLGGYGWRVDGDGTVPPATLFHVDDPQFFEVETYGGDPTKIRVAIGLTHLAPVAIASTARGTRVRFEPLAPLPPGHAVAFVAFGDDTTLDLERAHYQLRSVRWR